MITDYRPQHELQRSHGRPAHRLRLEVKVPAEEDYDAASGSEPFVYQPLASVTVRGASLWNLLSRPEGHEVAYEREMPAELEAAPTGTSYQYRLGGLGGKAREFDSSGPGTRSPRALFESI